MSRRFTVILIIVMAAALCALAYGCKKETSDDPAAGYQFALQGDEYAVIGYKGKTEITIPAAYKGKPVTSIADSAFYNSDISRAVISDGIKTVGSNAFAAARGLEYIFLPASVTTIGDNIFSECSALKKIEVAAGNPRFSALDGNLYDKPQKKLLAYSMGGALRDFAVPEGVEEIGAYVFYRCPSVDKLTLPSTLKTIKELAFTGARVSAFGVSEDNPYFAEEGGVLFSNSGATLYGYPSGKDEDDYTVPSGVKKLYNDAFAYSNAKTISLPDGLEEIGDRAFMNSALELIDIPRTVKTVGDSPFQNCVRLSQISVAADNAKYQHIGGNLYDKQGTVLIAYAVGQSAQELTVPSGVVEIAEFAFYGAANLERIELPESVKKVGDSAFDAYAIKSVTFNSDSPPSISPTSFSRIRAITIYVPNNSGEIYGNAWEDLRDLIREFDER